MQARTLFGLTGAAVTLVCCNFAPNAGLAATPGSNREPNEARAQQTNISRLYDQTCAKCHGDNGQGGGGGTSSLLTREKFDQKNDKPYFDAIKNGVPQSGMEAYGQTMTDSEIWGLVVHIREMQSRALRAEFGSPRAERGVYKSQRESFRLETVVDRDQGLRTPWAIDWLPDRTMLVTNKPGSLVLFKAGQKIEVEGLPPILDMGQGGLLDVGVHPQYAQNGWVYLAFTDPAKTGGRSGMTKLVRGKLQITGSSARWTGQQTLFEVDQSHYNGSTVHFGCRIVFNGKGHVFFSIGERGNQNLAQDLSKPNGKIYRINEDGSIPKDNPFVARPEAIPAIWSYGHRNPQGLTMDLEGNLWDTEHGPRGGDEVNLVQKGANYGWPQVSFSINYNDSPISTPWPKSGQDIQLPVFRWLPSIGACGLDVVRGNAFAGWRGDLVAGGLAGQNVDRIRVKGGKLIEREELIHGLGRVRDVVCGPDGYVYIAFNQPDIVVRMVPAK